MTPRIVKLVNSCGECQHYSYYSGGAYRCVKVDQNVGDKNLIAPFCPLPEYPARVIAGMDVTIRALREPQSLGFGVWLLSYVASRLECVLEPSAQAIAIPINTERSVRLALDHVTRVDVMTNQIEFVYGVTTYILHPDCTPPLLREEVVGREGVWTHYELASRE